MFVGAHGSMKGLSFNHELLKKSQSGYTRRASKQGGVQKVYAIMTVLITVLLRKVNKFGGRFSNDSLGTAG